MIHVARADVPKRPERPGEKHLCRVNGREALFEGDVKIPVPTRASYEDLFSPSADGKTLLVASNVRVREVTLETMEMRDLLQGPWLVSVKCLADGLVAVLGAEGTHRLERRDPDVAEMKSVKDMPSHLTWFEVQTPGMLFVLDTLGRPEKLLAESIALRADRIDSVLGGRVLVVTREDGDDDWRTTFYAVKGRKLHLMGRIQEDVGRVFDVDGRVYGGEGVEIFGLEEAWGAATIEEKTYEHVAVEGDFTFEPVPLIPPDPSAPRDAVVESLLKKIKPSIAKSSFKYALSFDGKRCVIATHDSVWDVDCKKAKAVCVAKGSTFVSVSLVGDVIAAIHRTGVDGTLDFWVGREKTMSIPCGKYDSLFMLHDGAVIALASEYAIASSKLRTHFIGAKGNDVRYLGSALRPFKHATCVSASSYVEDSEGRSWKIEGLGEALRKALKRPSEAIDLRLSDTERMASDIGKSPGNL